ncbi:unnamed protein product (macronuclear) [Paramecium tetraurelia]|uniref:Apple domain-containing protein n=1 Tax=Paramecium tetraurelia TaxID=5888 RepID=A0BFC1_PARTE|nr:uncharacterized protein GSPATT00028273001 [Paramecium tetraurelia]CAK57238.1 unnamed protein product [Paramecium tetraurelia]|eukprot:XP_001424636.1 hypothetical protein (macronuclear) [Paramecium tetraurelia strain d4-2]
MYNIQFQECKWDRYSKKCIHQQCTDANTSFYFTNEDCQSFKVFIGPEIIGSSGVGCQKWQIDWAQMITQINVN